MITAKRFKYKVFYFFLKGTDDSLLRSRWKKRLMNGSKNRGKRRWESREIRNKHSLKQGGSKLGPSEKVKQGDTFYASPCLSLNAESG
ncbi:hypothetical protein CEF21_03340 [Bacillus sp. FJAT-42376]|nr:hypothetical protein CEF21_03340 [Bacillus sp. FJAT-42376]